jgi:hypothetical protein
VFFSVKIWSDIHRHGIARGLQRYKCLLRARTFNALIGTPLARPRKRDRWLKYADALNASESVRAATEWAGFNVSTSFRWRHRFLSARKDVQDQRLTGIIEVDECFVWQAEKASDACRAKQKNAVARPQNRAYPASKSRS